MDQNDKVWLGKQILHPDHKHDLERESAVNEFMNKMPRQQAEGLAYDNYQKTQHLKAAGHHLAGMNSAKYEGRRLDAEQHLALYNLHMRILGHSPHGPVPAEVQSQAIRGEGKFQEFKGHPADHFLVGK